MGQDQIHLIGNILFAMVIMYGGWWSMVFGSLIALQRILEIIAVQVWGGYFAGITVAVMDLALKNEVHELISYGKILYKELIVGVIVLSVFMYVYYACCKFLLKSIKSKRSLQPLWRKILRAVLVLLLLALAWKEKAQTDIFFFEHKEDKSLEYFVSKNKYDYLTEKNPNAEKIDLYLLIGESVSKSQMSLYGYERKTTPYLDGLSKDTLSVWEDPIAAGAHTTVSFQAMFSRLDYANDEMFYLSPNIVEELNHSGYKTVWASYQRMNKRAYVFPALMKSADISLNAGNAYDDRVVLDLVSKNLQAEPSVYMIDVYGSHGPYEERIPEELKHFTKLETSDKKQATINAYDDMILIMDAIAKRTYDMAESHAKKTGRKFVVMYISDHGQNLYADGSDWAGHPANIELHPNGFAVPFFILNKKNLPCGDALPPLNEKRLKMARTFDFVLGGLCLFKK